ncbi:MAG: RES family NAD+ phosphorylase [Parvularculaceae bacterium]|nr:RES family NAD+ phosphorylase [Parvularculaceae bacterium]
MAPPPVVRAAFARTVRLVSSARLRDPVLRALVADEADLDALAEIEGATSGRLTATLHGAENVEAAEFVFGVPHAAFINASFAYWRPRALNRFNGPGRGAWYAALAVETCLAEVSFHLTAFLSDAGSFDAVVDYAELFASVAGEFLDLRAAPDHVALSPDTAIGYPAGNALAADALARGLNGVIYPSVRQAGGTCIAALRPAAVQSVAQGTHWRLEWRGTRMPSVRQLQPEEAQAAEN